MKRTHLFMWLLMPLFVFAQQLPNVIPPSPEAANAFKFSEIPVSLYTGLPNISIPLFEIESGGVKVPISISYHARGIQVAEITSRVGAGWTLNCGGMISKQVRDTDNGLHSTPCVDYTPDEPGTSPQTPDIYNSFSKRESALLAFADASRICDITPDQYSYTVNGLSGKFLPLEMQPQQFNNLKFSSSSGIAAIIDDQGNKYIFDGGDDVDNTSETLQVKQTGYTRVNGFVGAPNTSHLGHIITATGATIEFVYETENSNYYRRTNDINVAPDNVSNVSLISSFQKRMKTIYFDEGRIEFSYGSAYSLDSISLYDKLGQLVKRAIFDYVNITGPTDDNISWFSLYDIPAYTRRFLDAVHFVGKDGLFTPPYRFEYNATPLPSRHSNSIDLWGYYNGKDNGRFLEPLLDDRTVDPELAQAGMLTRIIKPEGGTIDFTYEPNIAVNVFPESVAIENTNPVVFKDVLVSHLDANTINPTIDKETGLHIYNGGKVYNNVFEISEFKTSYVKYDYEYTGVEGCPCASNSCQSTPGALCNFSAYIYHYNIATGQLGSVVARLEPGLGQIIVLEPGEYILKVTYTEGSTYVTTAQENTFRAAIYWYESLTSYAPNELQCGNMQENYTGTKIIYAAGNRIKKIEYRDAPNGAVALTKSYSYEDASGMTSGRILGLSAFVGVKTVAELNGSPAPVSWSFGSGGASLFTTYQSNNVGYKYVTEYLGDETGNIGKTEYEYSMIYDSGRYYEFPFHAPTDNEWLRGKELSVKHYKSVGDGYELVKSIENTYSLADQFNLSSSNQALCSHPFLKPSVYHDIDTDFPGGGMEKNRRYCTIPLSIIPTMDDAGELQYKTYYMTGGTLDLSKTVTTDYFDDGTEVSNTVEYRYDYDNHYSLAEEQRTTSTGASVLTKYFYPQDPEMAAKPARQALLAKNMVGSPLVTQSFKGIEKLSELETVYKVFGADILAPEIIKTAKGNDVLEERLHYNKVDAANGNVLEVQQANGIPISYIWGHNGQYPIAKIENATFQEILTALSTTEVALKSLTVAPANIRQLLPNAIVTTLTYKPLVGVTSITDPKGLATTYEYDSLGRLLRVKDHEGKILSENQYNFKNN